MARSFSLSLAFVLAALPLTACGGGGGGGGGSGNSPGAIGAACSAESACDAACDGDAECEEATVCLTGADQPGGLCTRTCATSADCPGPDAMDALANVCVVDPATSLARCVSGCNADGDCRAGYMCRTQGGAPRMYPGAGDRRLPRGRHAGPRTRVSRTAERRGHDHLRCSRFPGQLHRRPLHARWGRPSGSSRSRTRTGTTTLNLEGREALLSAGANELGSIAPIYLPQSPELPDVQGGQYSVRLITETDDLCLYVTSERPATGPQNLLVNVYPVGFDLDEDIADSNPFFERFFDELAEIFLAASVRGVNLPRFEEVDPAVSAAFGIITERGQVAELVQNSVDREALDKFSLNLFLVNGFDLPNVSGPLFGFSQGIPGAPGLHGTVGSGVVVSIEGLEETTIVPNPNFDDDEPEDPETNPRTLEDPTGGAAFTAVLAAHEMGHFLGLFNTSEPTQAIFDPLVDTPRCTDMFPDFTRAICPDGDNLMFPILTSQFQVGITPNQAFGHSSQSAHARALRREAGGACFGGRRRAGVRRGAGSVPRHPRSLPLGGSRRVRALGCPGRGRRRAPHRRIERGSAGAFAGHARGAGARRSGPAAAPRRGSRDAAPCSPACADGAGRLAGGRGDRSALRDAPARRGRPHRPSRAHAPPPRGKPPRARPAGPGLGRVSAGRSASGGRAPSGRPPDGVAARGRRRSPPALRGRGALMRAPAYLALGLLVVACASSRRVDEDAGAEDAGRDVDGAAPRRDSGPRDAAVELGADGPGDAGRDAGPRDAGDHGAGPGDAGDDGAGDPCADGRPRCAVAGARCEGDILIVCAEDDDRCLVESRRDCAGLPGGSCDPAGPRCALPPCGGVPAPCSTPGRRCDGDTLVICAELPSGCLAEERIACASVESGARCDAALDACVATPPDPCAGRPDACVAPERRCDGREELVVCAADAFGCLSETRTTCRAPDQPDAFCDAGTLVFCSDGEACAGPDLCTRPGVSCDAVTGELVVCEADAYDCLRERRIDCGATTRFATCVAGGGMAGCVVGSDPCANVATPCRPERRLCLGAELGICAPDAFGCLDLEVVRCAAAGRGCDPSTLACR